MGRVSIRVIVLPLIAVLLTIGAQAQVRFYAETLPIVTSGSAGCVQVGLFLNVAGMNQLWQTLVATLDYSADMGVLAGTPEARLSSFGSMAEPGLTNPATLQPPHMPGFMSPCIPSKTTNSVILNRGMPIPFMTATAMLMASESVNPMSMNSGRISLLAGGFLETRPMQDQLFAILTFPITGNPGSIRITFSMALPGANGLVDTNMMTVSAATTAGSVRIQSVSVIPTLSEWGIIAFMAGLVLSGLFLLRQKRMIPS